MQIYSNENPKGGMDQSDRALTKRQETEARARRDLNRVSANWHAQAMELYRLRQQEKEEFSKSRA